MKIEFNCKWREDKQQQREAQFGKNEGRNKSSIWCDMRNSFKMKIKDVQIIHKYIHTHKFPSLSNDLIINLLHVFLF